MVFPFLRPFNKPRMHTFGEFVAFLTQICVKYGRSVPPGFVLHSNPLPLIA